MKKLLIATAAMAVVAGAQAQSSVTVYGVVDVNVTNGKTTNAGSNSTALGDNGLNTSRLGFKGTEDLGGGLKAEFQLEGKLVPSTGKLGTTGTNSGTSNVTSPAATIFNREAWVGLSSATLGSIRMGRSDVTSAQGLDSAVGQAGNLSDATSNLGTDVASVIRYTTPTFAGFTAQVGVSSADSTVADGAVDGSPVGLPTETTNNRIVSGYVQYEAGNLGVYAGQTTKQIAAGYSQREDAIGAKYNFGVATVGAYRSVRNGSSQSLDNSAGEYTQSVYSVSAPVQFLGAGVTAHGVYYKNEYAVANQAGDVDGYKLALTKAFSKRTTGYVAYVDQSTNNTTDKDAKAYVVGVSHAF
jgi:predicted porin